MARTPRVLLAGALLALLALAVLATGPALAKKGQYACWYYVREWACNAHASCRWVNVAKHKMACRALVTASPTTPLPSSAPSRAPTRKPKTASPTRKRKTSSVGTAKP